MFVEKRDSYPMVVTCALNQGNRGWTTLCSCGQPKNIAFTRCAICTNDKPLYYG